VTAADFAPETAIGGGPVLLKGGKVENTWEAEMFYGDGADDKMPEARHPRTAIGVTKDGLLILFVCEGRGMTDGVAGMTFAEEAAVMKALGCVDALNLDGGGSSCLLVEGKETIKVSDGSQRAVGSIILLKRR
jgi:exopolysaccharide biosynthesis protein